MSAFCKEPSFFAENEFDFSTQIDQIHNESFNDNFARLWIDYDEFFTETECQNEIKSLKTNKDAGPMRISVSTFKKNALALAPVICSIFNAILSNGIVPQSWKKNSLVPIPKKGNRQDVNNYRGISLQSVLPKIFDGLLTKKFIYHVNQLISISQHGFIEKKGTLSNLLEFTQTVFAHGQRKNETHCVYFDFEKAFDRVSHLIIAKKLAEISIPKAFMKDIVHFFIGRQYALKADGIISSDFTLAASSVPQGSHIGPAPFFAPR